VIIVEVNYGQKGEVRACRVVRSNAPMALESSTLDQIRRHWGGAFFANSTEIAPIIFEDAPAASYWVGDMAPPPNFFADHGREHEITARVTFGPDGWVTACAVILPSGVELADKEIVAWIKVHWHSAAHANKVVDAPFVFQPPTANAPAKLAQPESPEKAPVEDVEPDKAIPAVRAQ
jgi:hypothetical protein